MRVLQSSRRRAARTFRHMTYFRTMPKHSALHESSAEPLALAFQLADSGSPAIKSQMLEEVVGLLPAVPPVASSKCYGGGIVDKKVLGGRNLFERTETASLPTVLQGSSPITALVYVLRRLRGIPTKTIPPLASYNKESDICSY